MFNPRNFLVALLLAVPLHGQARASETDAGPISGPIEKFLLSLVTPSNSCPPPVSADASVSVATLEESYRSALEAQDDCEAFEAANDLLHTVQDAAHQRQWAENALKSLLHKGDYRNTALIGMRTLLEFTTFVDPEAQKTIRLLILRGVDGAIRELGPERDPGFLAYGLGMKDQGAAQARYLSFQAYLDSYPKDESATEVKAMLENAINTLVDRELKIAHGLEVQTEYMGALTRLEALYANDVVLDSPRLPEIIFNVVRLDLLFADAIAHPPWIPLFYRWPDDRLLEVFRLPQDQKMDRTALVQLLKSKAWQLADFLKQQYPADSNTRRALELLKKQQPAKSN